MAKRKPWTVDANGVVTVRIPPSVEMTCSLDDGAMLAEYRESYGGPVEWIGKGGKMRLSRRALVEIVTTTAHLAGDHMAEGELSAGGALRWAYRMQNELRAAGWAKPGAYGYEATV